MSADVLIASRDVSKTYLTRTGNTDALRAMDVTLATGEFVSLVGPSGCGKSTFLRCIAALEPISGGALTFRGLPITEPPHRLGVVFQRDALLDWRTVIDNVLLGVEFSREPGRDYRPKALTLLDGLGLRDFVNKHPWELSGGMRQRVAIARALIGDPELLLMDEPFGSLDALTRDELNVELQRMWLERRPTVLLITHSIAEAVFLSDRVAVMSPRPGTIVETIPIELARPRPLAVLDSPEFTVYTRRIRSIFEQQGVFTPA